MEIIREYEIEVEIYGSGVTHSIVRAYDAKDAITQVTCNYSEHSIASIKVKPLEHSSREINERI